MWTSAEREPGDTADIRECLAAISDALDAVESAPDSASRFETVTELQRLTRDLDAAVTTLRVATAGQLWESERLSLSKLADRIGVSKARADQLVRSFQQSRESGE